MSSIASSLYGDGDDDQRANCYTCNSDKSGSIKVAGRNHRLECREFTEIGNAFETMAVITMTSIFMMNLIDIVEVGVDSARLSFGQHFEFCAQSRGGGGLSKYDCGSDYQIPELIKHEKVGNTERLYVHWKGCPSKLISTELHGMWYTNDTYSDGRDTNNQLTDTLVVSARKAIAKQAEYTDIIGVYGSANKMANSYDGILAQAYWAYTLMAYFHSVEFTVDESVLVDGTFLHAKYAGAQSTIDVQYDSTLPSDANLNRYATYMEVYQAIVNWLNDDVLTESGRKYVDATYNANKIIATSKWTERTVELQMFVDANETVADWSSCEVFTGVSYDTLQGRMPIDERPHLVEWQRYNPDNILTELPRDLYYATRDMDQERKPNGAEWALYIDPYVLDMYDFARQQRTATGVQSDIREKYNVYKVPALGAHGGTGLWFVTLSSPTESLRNVAHLIDSVRSGSDISDIYVGPADFICEEAQIKHDTLHGVTVKDWRLFASNLLCSPFVDTLGGKEPWEKTLPYLPCWNRKVRDNYNDPNNFGDCRIRAQFEITDEYQNAALYAIPLAGGGYDIRVLEDGDTLPVGALPVFEIQITDTTVGILSTQLSEVTYEYVVTTSDGTEVTYSAKNPIIQYIGNAAGIAFNVEQTVTIPSANCSSEYDASTAFEEDFPFRMAGACNDSGVTLEGRIDKTNDYILDFVGDEANGDVQVTIVGGGTDTIDLSGNPSGADAEAAAVIINTYLSSNGYAGVAVGDNSTLLVTVTDSVDVVFDTVESEPLTVENIHRITMLDSTVWDAADGIADIDIFVKCQGAADPATPTFEAFPSLEIIGSCPSTGWTITADVVSILGCTYEGLTVNVATITSPDQSASFDLTT